MIKQIEENHKEDTPPFCTTAIVAAHAIANETDQTNLAMMVELAM